MKLVAVMLPAALAAGSLFAQSIPPAQLLHAHPIWPTNEEFLQVNSAIEVARKAHPEIDSELIWALIWEESKYDPLALGTKGEVGLGQLMPATASALGVPDRTNVQKSVQASVNHLAHLTKKYKSNLQFVLAAYNAGEPAVDRCKCVPLASRAYVDRIEQNRFFAQKIVEYLKTSVIPMTAQDAAISDLHSKVQQLSAHRLAASDERQSSQWDSRLNETQEKLREAIAASDRLRADNKRLRAQLSSQENAAIEGGADAAALSGAVGELEKRSESGESAPGATTDLPALEKQVSSLRAALSAKDALSESTKQNLADLTARLERLSRLYGAEVETPRLTGAKEILNRRPVVAVVAAAESGNSVTADPALEAALQDTLLRHGIDVNVELENEDFVSHNMGPLLGGEGAVLRSLRPHSGPKWDYALVVKLSESAAEAAMSDMHSFKGSAECRIYNQKGVLLTTRSFSETGTGFSEQQARDASAARLAKLTADYVTLAIKPEKAQEETKP